MKDQFYEHNKIISNTVASSVGGDNPEIVSQELDVMTIGANSSMNHPSVR